MQGDVPEGDHYDEAVPATIPISETFTSIQGEGKLTGVPSWFCRVSGCNLRCGWCDTPYASWNPEGEARAIDDLLGEARSSGVRHAVVTGGEPMMFPQLTEFSARLAAECGMHITIETAGTVIPPGGVTCHLISISPKLANSTPRGDVRDPLGVWTERHEARRLNAAVLRALLDQHDPARAREGEHGRDRQVKFVVREAAFEADLREIEALLSEFQMRSDDVLLMPEGVTRPRPEFARRVAEECVVRGWRYCMRLHIELFGNTRGT